MGTAAVCEVGMTTGDPDRVRMDEGVTYNEKITSHVLDVGANYWSVWNWHNEAAKNVLSFYDKYPEPIAITLRGISVTEYIRRSSGLSRETELPDW